MSLLDSEDRELLDCSSGSHSETHSKLSYTREFLLSLRELEICQKLPTGLDQSILSELESVVTPDCQRTAGGFPSQGFRRHEYGSSPPNRGVSGRWENRFSVRSDQESDAQSVRDSEPSRRPGNQFRRFGRSSEHDGLLGSGSFPRPSIYTPSGVPTPKPRGNDSYQLNKSNEPYHPPRPYKAGPQSRRDASDSFNNETFGSVDCASEDRVEEERKRRASFELMRKEQHSAASEKKQILNLEEVETECASDSVVSALAEDVKEDEKFFGRKESDASTTSLETDNGSGKSSVSLGSVSRPLIPPGFKSTLLEKDSGHKVLTNPSLKKAGKPETVESLVHSAVDPIQNIIFDSLEGNAALSSQNLISIDLQLDDKSINAPLLKKGDQIDHSNKMDCMDENIHHPSGILGTKKPKENPEIIGLSAVFSPEEFEDKSNLNQSASILDKIFGSSTSLAVDEYEYEDTNPDDKRSSRNIKSSKFAHWFSEEVETKQGGDSTSNTPSDLLSLIVGGDNHIPQVCDVMCSSDTPDTIMPNVLAAATPEICEPPQCASNRDKVVPSVLTCEDLEQTILSEYSENSSNLQSLLPGWSTNPMPEEPRKGPVDDHASQHLLSLLHKGPDLGNNKISNSCAEDNSKSVEEGNHTLGKTITLETLFGTAFMNELQSMQAPVSIQSGSNAFGQTDNMGGSRSASNDNSIFVDRERTNKLDNPVLLGFDDSLIDPNSKYQTDWTSFKNNDPDGLLGLRLPKDDSLLFNGGNTVHPQVPLHAGDINLNRGEFLLPGATVGPRGVPFLHSSQDHHVEPEMFQNLSAQPSSSQFYPMQMTQGRSSSIHPFETLPAHSNSQMNVMGPDMARNQFSGNMMRQPFHQTGFDLPNQHPILKQQVQMPGNYPHMLHDQIRSGPMSHPGGNQPASFLQDRNPMQGLSYGMQPPNIDGFGVPMRADIINRGTNQPPGAIQRLLEMEGRGTSKQMHPFAGAGYSQGMYGHELNMGQRHR
ncbi:unnamed protein product [Cuscuta campestris]|uniref:Uncharacterized protein n=1 Tax=Cuscuta campestris TaxID=132261 RepID=A0A484M0Y6_9ASTE|nr:unnamed protein product [Cuscuta campestris]